MSPKAPTAFLELSEFFLCLQALPASLTVFLHMLPPLISGTYSLYLALCKASPNDVAKSYLLSITQKPPDSSGHEIVKRREKGRVLWKDQTGVQSH